jgi:hypothetical protein
MAFSGAMFIDDNDAVAVANMAQGTQAHERLQKLISTMPQFKMEELEQIYLIPRILELIAQLFENMFQLELMVLKLLLLLL